MNVEYLAMSRFRGCGSTALYIKARAASPAPGDIRGLALVLGWTAGAYKHVHKHAALWHNLGLRTVTATMDLAMTFRPARLTAVEWVADNPRARCHPLTIGYIYEARGKVYLPKKGA